MKTRSHQLKGFFSPWLPTWYVDSLSTCASLKYMGIPIGYPLDKCWIATGTMQPMSSRSIGGDSADAGSRRPTILEFPQCGRCQELQMVCSLESGQGKLWGKKKPAKAVCLLLFWMEVWREKNSAELNVSSSVAWPLCMRKNLRPWQQHYNSPWKTLKHIFRLASFEGNSPLLVNPPAVWAIV